MSADPGAGGRAFVALQHLLPQHGISRLVQLVRDAVLEPLARRGRRREDLERLAAMDDRLLADLGLRRSELVRVVGPPRGDGSTPPPWR